MPSGRTMGFKVGLLASEAPPDLSKPDSVLAQLGAVVPLLKEQKGTWFRVADFEANAGATGAATRARKKYPKVEWRSRRVGEQGSSLYARWPA